MFYISISGYKEKLYISLHFSSVIVIYPELFMFQDLEIFIPIDVWVCNHAPTGFLVVCSLNFCKLSLNFIIWNDGNNKKYPMDISMFQILFCLSNVPLVIG